MAAALYRGLAWAAEPLAPLVLARRRARGKEDAARLPERLGRSPLARPPGPLVWTHAASVGEALSVLPLLERVRAARGDAALLVTTGTVTSARLLADRLPRGALHQFAPVDTPGAVGRFLDRWRPDLALWVESELWPTLLGGAQARMPVVLVQGRLSERSARRWTRAAGLVRPLVAGFALVLAQGEADARRLAALGARDVRLPGNLKGAAPPLPADPDALESLRAATAGRAVWAAASTHAGEEEAVLAAHHAAAARVPGLLTLIAPRHPERGAAVAEIARAAGLAATRRSLGEPPAAPVHVVDTLGELGLVYRVARAAFVGGSLVPRGGHNPVEAARLGCPVLMGPHAANVAGLAEPLARAGALATVADAPALAATLVPWLADDAARARAAEAALRATAGFDGALDAVAAAVLPFVERLPRGHARA